MIFDEVTGGRLRQFRLYIGLKQREMAVHFGTSRGTYSCWESKYKTKRLPKHVERKAIEISLVLYPPKPIHIVPVRESWFRRLLRFFFNKFKKSC